MYPQGQKLPPLRDGWMDPSLESRMSREGSKCQGTSITICKSHLNDFLSTKEQSDVVDVASY